MARVSFFKGTFNSSEEKSMDLLTVLKEVKTEKYKSTIAKIRLESNKAKRDELKRNTLPMVTFAGTFATRSNGALKKSSGFAIMDFDCLGDLDLLIDQFENDDYTYCCFVSPSGNGLKVLVKIPPVPDDKTY